MVVGTEMGTGTGMVMGFDPNIVPGGYWVEPTGFVGPRAAVGHFGGGGDGVQCYYGGGGAQYFHGGGGGGGVQHYGGGGGGGFQCYHEGCYCSVPAEVVSPASEFTGGGGGGGQEHVNLDLTLRL